MPFSSFVFGLIAGFLSSFGLRLWQYHRDHWLKRVDWFCERLEQTAVLATDYWCDIGTSADAKNPENTSLAKKREAQILGLQIRLDGLVESFINNFDYSHQISIRKMMVNWNSALTGGDFMSLAAKQDIERTREIQSICSDLFVEVRKASDKANSAKSIFLQLIPSKKNSINKID